MAKSKYAHFFVMKMLRYGTKAQKQIIVKEMEGKMAKVNFCFFIASFLDCSLFSYHSSKYCDSDSFFCYRQKA